MEFTREAWENAPKGATLRYVNTITEEDLPVHLIGYKTSGYPVIEYRDGRTNSVCVGNLRIILPKRKVTVQLWRMTSGCLTTAYVDEGRWCAPADWILLGEHTFEIEGE